MYTMLRIIQNEIESEILDSTSFESMYRNYILDVQEKNLDKEISYMLSHNVVDIELLDRAFTDAFKQIASDFLYEVGV